MDDPPRKRRKTSSPVRPSSSPLRQPPRRPSFASPTKASLARNYPTLLPTRTSPRDDVRPRSEESQALSLEGLVSSPKEKEGTREEAELPSQRVEAQQGSPRGGLLSPPSKRPQRALGATRRSPLAEAPDARRNQLSRPVEEPLAVANEKEKVRKQPLDPEVEKRKQEKARLQHEIEELEAQVSRCANDIVAEHERAVDHVLPPAHRADLM